MGGHPNSTLIPAVGISVNTRTKREVCLECIQNPNLPWGCSPRHKCWAELHTYGMPWHLIASDGRLFNPASALVTEQPTLELDLRHSLDIYALLTAKSPLN